MDDLISKTELIDLIHAERDRLEGALARLTEAQMTEPGIVGRWSTKDILSHLTFWEQKMLHRLRTGIVPQPAPGQTWDQMTDEMNEQNWTTTRSKALNTVLDEFHASHEEVLKYLETIGEEEMNDPNRYEWYPGEPIWRYIAADTYEHYREHAEPILAIQSEFKSGQLK
jgi:uncharacterized protein (TIGR03083 family)